MLKFTTILHGPRKTLGLSMNEYCMADMVYQLSNNPEAPSPGWCTMTRENMGLEIGVSKRSAINLAKKLREKGIVEFNSRGNMKTTKLWYGAVILKKSAETLVKKVHQDREKPGEESSPELVKKVHQGRGRKFTEVGEESSPYIYNDIYNDKNKDIYRRDSEKKSGGKNGNGATPHLTPSPQPTRKIPPATKHFVEEGPRVNRKQMYESFLSMYNARGGSRMETLWMQLSEEDLLAISEHLPGYLKSNEPKYIKTPINYLKSQEWENTVINRHGRAQYGISPEMSNEIDEVIESMKAS